MASARGLRSQEREWISPDGLLNYYRPDHGLGRQVGARGVMKDILGARGLYDVTYPSIKQAHAYIVARCKQLGCPAPQAGIRRDKSVYRFRDWPYVICGCTDIWSIHVVYFNLSSQEEMAFEDELQGLRFETRTSALQALIDWRVGNNFCRAG